MRYLIKAPVDSEQPDSVMEFDSQEELDQWLAERNAEIWDASPQNDSVNFPMQEIL